MSIRDWVFRRKNVKAPVLPQTTPRASATPGKTVTPAQRTLPLTCVKCGQLYKLGEDAFAITTSGVLDRFAAVTVLTDGSKSDNREDPDLVDTCDWSSLNRADFHRNQIVTICSLTDSGTSRWWQCRKCGQTQQYHLTTAASAVPLSTATTGTGNPSPSPDIVSDTNSGLMWQRKHEDKKMTQDEAIAYCRLLRLADHSDWSLPSLAQFGELRKNSTVVNELSEADDVFWTATDFEYRPTTQAYASDGTSFNKTSRFFARAVRRL